MSNFDEKFGPQPVHVSDEMRVLVLQFIAVFIVSMSIQPSFLHRPQTSEVSVALCSMFSILMVIGTIVVHRSFMKPL